jgi:hypothetical protein
MTTATTKKPSLANLIDSTNIPESLVRAVVRQMGGWESFKEKAPDITRHGIGGGYHGFIYYADTLRFAHTHRKEILKLARDQAEDCGLGLVEMIEQFNCLKDCKPTELELIEGLAGVSNEKQVPNALAWFAGEEVARAYNTMTEEV